MLSFTLLTHIATIPKWLQTIRSNQPAGAMMPSSTHGIFARTSVMSAAPLILSSFAVLASASKDSWESLGSDTCRRLNLALFAAGVGSALWVGNAGLLTRIPGTDPLVSHQSYTGLTRSALIGAYGATAALSVAVWARSLPEEVRTKPLTWPGRIADGCAKSLVSLAPANINDPVNVKYSLLATSFLVFTAIGFGPFPLAVVPSWTGRRCSRAFPAWTLLAATSSYNLKEARESGKVASHMTSHAPAFWCRALAERRVGCIRRSSSTRPTARSQTASLASACSTSRPRWAPSATTPRGRYTTRSSPR